VDAEVDATLRGDADATLRVDSLFIHPVKSCRAVRVQAAELLSTGLRHDREFMVVDEHYSFITQRECPALARLAATVHDGVLSLCGDDGRVVEVSLDVGGADLEVEIWGDKVAATDCGGAAAGLLTNFTGSTARLVRMRDGFRRSVDPDYAERGDDVGFADAFPLLVTTAAAIAAARDEIGPHVDARRFRPNIVVAGAEAFAEDEWHTIRIGETIVELVKPCARCRVLDVDPDTGEGGGDVLKGLAAMRTREHRVLFGQNAIPRKLGTIAVGDAVRVVRRSR
jgi:uncharacterized protein